MGELYEAILSTGEEGQPQRLKIGHWFESLMGEYGAGDITGAEATAIFEQMSGGSLSATMQTEVQDLIGTVTAIAVPAAPSKPNAPASGANVATVRAYAIAVADYAEQGIARAVGKADRAMRVHKIMRIFELAQHRATGYDTAADLRSRLGVPTR